jgi:hypothetical protein
MEARGQGTRSVEGRMEARMLLEVRMRLEVRMHSEATKEACKAVTHSVAVVVVVVVTKEGLTHKRVEPTLLVDNPVGVATRGDLVRR